MSVYNIDLTKSSKKGRVKPDFILLPQQRRAPIIKSQPIRNFIQYTHLDKQGNPLQVQPIDNTVTLIKGTTFSFSAIVEDPSNTFDPYSSTNLRFVWKQNDSEIYALSLLNDGKGSSALYLEGSSVTPEVNGVYTLEITNEYGTTISEPFNLEVIDTLEHPLLYRNLIQNDNGSRGLENWTISGDIIVQQMAASLIESQNFASIWNGAAQSRADGTTLDPFQNEIPFVFGNSSNWVNFDELFSNVQRGNANFAKEREFWYTKVTPNLINNERPGQNYGAFFPSPLHIDVANNNQTKSGNLLESLGLTDTYFTRNKILFGKDGGSRQAAMSQVVDLSAASTVVDGNVPGISRLVAQLFAYVGIGISKYEYKITYADGTTTSVPTTYLLDSLQLDNVLNVGGNPTTGIRRDLQETLIGDSLRTFRLTVKQIRSVDIQPIAQDKLNMVVDCLDANNAVIESTIINGPDETDIFAVKEKFYISEMFSSLFLLALDLNKQETNIPFFIFGKQYFELPGLGGLNKKETQVKNEITRTQSQLNDVNAAIKEIENIRVTSIIPIIAAAQLADQLLQRRKLPALRQQRATLNKIISDAQGELVKTTNAKRALTDQNRVWLSQNHPKSSNAKTLRADVFKDTEIFLVDRFDKGAAAMFGISKTITVPSKTRSIRLAIQYNHTSKAFYDQNPNYPSSTEISWNKSEIYGEHAGDLRRYPYNYPKTAITQVKIQLFPNKVQVHPTYPTYVMPRTQVLPGAKADLFLDVHNSTSKVIYKKYTPVPATALSGSALTEFRNRPIQAIADIVNNTNLSSKNLNALITG